MTTARPGDFAHQLGFGHVAPAFDIQFLRFVVELVARTLLERLIGIARSLGSLVGSLPLLATLFVYGSSGNLLGALLPHTAFLAALLNMLVLSFVLFGPGGHNSFLLCCEFAFDE